MTDKHSDQIDRLIHDTLAAPVPDDVSKRLHQRTVRFPASKQHRYRHPMMVRLAVAAAVMFISAGMWSALKVSRPDDAFAQAARQLRTVRTMSYLYTIAINGGTTPIADFDMHYKYPGIIRMTGVIKEAYDITDYSTGNTLLVNGNLKVYKTISGISRENDIADWLEMISHFPEQYDEDMGEEVVDGMTLHKYRVIYDSQLIFVWLAPDGSIHRIESTDNEPRDDGVLSAYGIYTNIVINPDLPDSLFNMSIPEGYTYSEGFAM